MEFDYFERLQLSFPAWKGDGRMKGTDHPTRHPRVHASDRASAEVAGVYARNHDQFGRGQYTVLGWSDPTLGHGSVPKVMLGSLQPNTNLLRCFARAGRRIQEESGEGRR